MTSIECYTYYIRGTVGGAGVSVKHSPCTDKLTAWKRDKTRTQMTRYSEGRNIGQAQRALWGSEEDRFPSAGEDLKGFIQTETGT